MLQKLASRNDDIRRLLEMGYAVDHVANCLVIRDIPYLDGGGSLRWGSMVIELEFVNNEQVRQVDHQIMFAGGAPHGLDGNPIPNLGDRARSIVLSSASGDIVVERAFSNKPRAGGGFPDFYAKVESYTAIIAGPAIERYGISPYTFRAGCGNKSDSVFGFNDTMSSRAGIEDMARLFAGEVVAIIGLGGTGAYVLDLIVKTPVREIRAFDHDQYCVHNAFRSPGRLISDELGQSKASVYRDRYKNFHKGLSVIEDAIDSKSADKLEGVTFAFVCVDSGTSRAAIIGALCDRAIPFIDVGMGLTRQSDALNGQVRITYLAPENAAEILESGIVPIADGADDVYRENVQLGELNALNASLAVIRYKQVRGFYCSDDVSHHHVLAIGTFALFGLEHGSAV